MRLFDQSCRQHRQAISLLAAGALPLAEQDAVAQHLSTCPACREYFAQIKAVTTPLATWAGCQPQVEPTPAAQQRWVRAIQAANQSAPPLTPLSSPITIQTLWQKLIQPNRHAWAGLAAVWGLLIGINMALHDQSLAKGGKSVTMAAMINYGDQQKLLNELFADRSTTVDADRPKTYSPKPRTEKAQFFTT